MAELPGRRWPHPRTRLPSPWSGPPVEGRQRRRSWGPHTYKKRYYHCNMLMLLPQGLRVRVHLYVCTFVHVYRMVGCERWEIAFRRCQWNQDCELLKNFLKIERILLINTERHFLSVFLLQNTISNAWLINLKYFTVFTVICRAVGERQQRFALWGVLTQCDSQQLF